MSRRDGTGTLAALRLEDLLLLAAVAALPWFWGGVLLDAQRCAGAVVALAAGWALARRGAKGLGLGRDALWLLPAFLLGGWAFLQAAPLPRAWVEAVSPKAASIQRQAFGPAGQTSEAWLRGIEADARARVPEASAASASPAGPMTLDAEAPAPPTGFTLSLAPFVTLERAFWYAALLLAFLLVLRRTADERVAAVYRATLFLDFAALAVLGIVNRLTAPGRMLWLRDTPPETHAFGPYVNPSHFAGAMELAVPWLLGWGLASLVDPGASRRARGRHLLAIGAAACCAAATLLAASKMAAATIGVAAAVLVGAAIVSSRGRARSLLIAGSAAVAILFAAIALFGPLRGRVADFQAVHVNGPSQGMRLIAWNAGSRMASDFLLAGSGFGAFADVIPAYLPRGEYEAWLQLHNDYLEVVLAGGLVGAALVVWLAAAFGWRVARGIRLAAARGRALPALGIVLGLVALAAHEAVDFNLQIPANALLFVAIAAMCVSPLARSGDAA